MYTGSEKAHPFRDLAKPAPRGHKPPFPGTAAQMKLPMLIVMYNNRAYYNDWAHQIHIAEDRGRPVENAAIGQAITDPPPDFASLARSMGWYAEGPIETPDGIAPALQRAIREVQAGRPALVDTVTQFT